MPVIISAILGIINSVVGGISQDQQTKLQLLLQENEQVTALLKAQAAVDNSEAQSTNVFIAGWRPFLGWGLSIAVVFVAIVPPFTQWICGLIGHPVPEMPHFDPIVMEMMMGMLGLNIGARSYEKLKGVNGQH